MTDSLEIPHSYGSPHSPLAIASWLLLMLWLAGSVAAFWYLERREVPVKAVDVARVEQWYRDNYGPASQGGSTLTFIHLYKPGCSCNQYAEPKLARLVERYRSRGVRFLVAPSGPLDPGAHTPLELPTAAAKHDALVDSGIDSAPAALIFDVDGRLMNYGEYSDSAWCGSTGSSMEPALDRALSGLATARRPRAPRGCFCGW